MKRQKHDRSIKAQVLKIVPMSELLVAVQPRLVLKVDRRQSMCLCGDRARVFSNEVGRGYSTLGYRCPSCHRVWHSEQVETESFASA